MELRDAFGRFAENDIKLYAISYDDQQALSEFAKLENVPYKLLSDIDSEVIRRFGILNTQTERSGGPLYGVPYPGTYVVDEDGVVVDKFFYDSYKRRDSAENLIDAALGRVVLAEDNPRARGGDEEIRVSATLHGGNGSLKQGAMRRLVVRFELREGLHIYGEPVPEGMLPTSVEVSGPDGIVFEDPVYPPTTPLRLEASGLTLPIWSGTVDVQIPVYALSRFVSECRPVDQESVTLEVTVRYQACDDHDCLLPRTETLNLEVPVEPVDVQKIGIHAGHGQRESPMHSMAHMRRLVLRKARSRPWALFRYLWQNVRLEWAALRRRAAPPPPDEVG